MKAIVVYYSMSGNMKQVAESVASKLSADVLALHPVKAFPDKGAKKFLWGGRSAVMGSKPKLQPYIFNGKKYDTVIFGSPVWASNMAPPLRTFIEDNKEALEGKRFAGAVCFMGSGGQRALKKLKKALGIENLAAELTLVEPKDKSREEVEAQIREFCDALKASDDQG